jgi:hypothetical protein
MNNSIRRFAGAESGNPLAQKGCTGKNGLVGFGLIAKKLCHSWRGFFVAFFV